MNVSKKDYFLFTIWIWSMNLSKKRLISDTFTHKYPISIKFPTATTFLHPQIKLKILFSLLLKH